MRLNSAPAERSTRGEPARFRTALGSNARSAWRGGRLYGAYLLCVRLHARSDRSVRLPRNDFGPGDGSDRRQAFAAKAQRRNGFQLTGAPKLAGRVAAYRERQVFGSDSCAVVEHFDQVEAAAFYVNRNTRRAGIDRIFDELLYEGGGAIDDFSGSDLTDRQRVEFANVCHDECFAAQRVRPGRLSKWPDQKNNTDDGDGDAAKHFAVTL